MSQSHISKLLEMTYDFAKVEPIFEELRSRDPERVAGLEEALHSRVKESRELLATAHSSHDRLRYALYRQATEIADFTGPLRGVSHMLVARENELRKHAFICTEQFFTDLTRALDVYFDQKRVLMEEHVRSESAWHTGLRDTARKTATLVNLAQRGVNSVRGLVTNENPADDPMVDTRTIVEQTIDAYLDRGEVQADIEKILESAEARFIASWKRVIDQNAPSSADLKAFSGLAPDRGAASTEFQVSAADGTFLMGMSSAVAATLGLAAGWHTITWALLNVFPPAAAFAVLATVVVAVFTREKAEQHRIAAVRQAVQDYYRTFLTYMNTEELENLDGKTTREAMLDQSAAIIQSTLDHWTTTVIGELGVEDYLRLADALDSHRQIIDECLENLK